MTYEESRQAKLQAKAGELEAQVAALLDQQAAVKKQQKNIAAYARRHLELVALYQAKLEGEEPAKPGDSPQAEQQGPAPDTATVLQSVAAAMTSDLAAIQVVPCELAAIIKDTNPDLAAKLVQSDPEVMQYVARHVAGVMCTRTTEHIAQHDAQPVVTEVPEDSPTAADDTADASAPSVLPTPRGYGPAKSVATARSTPLGGTM